MMSPVFLISYSSSVIHQVENLNKTAFTGKPLLVLLVLTGNVYNVSYMSDITTF